MPTSGSWALSMWRAPGATDSAYLQLVVLWAAGSGAGIVVDVQHLHLHSSPPPGCAPALQAEQAAGRCSHSASRCALVHEERSIGQVQLQVARAGRTQVVDAQAARPQAQQPQRTSHVAHRRAGCLLLWYRVSQLGVRWSPAAAGEAGSQDMGGWGRGCTVAPGLMPASSIATGHGGGQPEQDQPEAAAATAPTPRPRLRLRSCRPAPASPTPHVPANASKCQGGRSPRGPSGGLSPAASPDSPYPSSSARHRVALPGLASLPPPLLVRRKRKQGRRSAQQVRLDSAPRWRTATDPVSPDAPTTPAPAPAPRTRRIPADRGNTAAPLTPTLPVQPVSTVPRPATGLVSRFSEDCKSLGLELSAPGKNFQAQFRC